MLEGMHVRIAAGCAFGVKDVMRGEETQLFGALTLWPELGEGRRLVILPGTHSKWVWLEDATIVSFATMLTGELFALLQSSSLLPLRGTGPVIDDASGFATGIAQAQASPGIIGKLFSARAGQLREDRSAAWARSYLSGLLIAGEIMEMRTAISMPQHITLIGDAALCDRYARALGAFDLDSTMLDGEASVLAGLELLDAID
jgi:2-dehydro-3-deoxygalactonokinase